MSELESKYKTATASRAYWEKRLSAHVASSLRVDKLLDAHEQSHCQAMIDYWKSKALALELEMLDRPPGYGDFA